MSKVGARPFAVFDIDGTIIRWQLYHAIGDQLAKQGVIGADVFKPVRAARMSWKKRSGEVSFRDYEAELVKVFDKTISGLPVATFDAAVASVFDEYREQVYTYTRDLISQLKATHYLLFAISGSPAVIVEKLANYYGFDDFAATTYPTSNGRFVGSKDLAVNKKPELLKALIDKHGAGSANSIGVGDSEGDIDMLGMVEQPIAFNPTRELFNHAKAQGWQVVVERKNMVYELTARQDGYWLESSDA